MKKRGSNVDFQRFQWRYEQYQIVFRRHVVPRDTNLRNERSTRARRTFPVSAAIFELRAEELDLSNGRVDQLIGPDFLLNNSITMLVERDPIGI